ncbi:hypothetical protein CIB84_005328 [Bambusicola thoracicus]|uniref:Uncharacterized protein n=1 Tax=Bambusicola thoracicus TaxID=9083 RepID=A0A2P4T3J1_BAMTH|nr:hypothetical protein CIB84_005328 [Bambusicola thoracicus]
MVGPAVAPSIPVALARAALGWFEASFCLTGGGYGNPIHLPPAPASLLDLQSCFLPSSAVLLCNSTILLSLQFPCLMVEADARCCREQAGMFAGWLCRGLSILPQLIILCIIKLLRCRVSSLALMNESLRAESCSVGMQMGCFLSCSKRGGAVVRPCALKLFSIPCTVTPCSACFVAGCNERRWLQGFPSALLQQGLLTTHCKSLFIAMNLLAQRGYSCSLRSSGPCLTPQEVH